MKIILALVTTLLCTFSLSASAVDEKNTDDNGYLLHGYDPISYFNHSPEIGQTEHSLQHKGVTLLFVNTENMKRFKQDPDHYFPKYGAYCAYGVRMGKKLDIDPLAYAIVDDELYVLLNRATKAIWEKERMKNIGIADRLWPSLKSVSSSQQ